MQAIPADRSAQAASPRRLPGFAAQVMLVLRKDLAIEARTGEVVVSSGFFAVLCVVLVSLALFGGPTTGRLVAAGAIWISVAFATVLALGRSWQREREEAALDGLLVAPIDKSALFVGKALSVLGFLFAIEIVVIPLAALFFSIDLIRTGPGVVAIALVATPGIAATGTLFGSMTVRTQARDLLLAVVLFPLLAPTLLTAVVATRELFGGVALSELGDYFLLMGVFDLMFGAGGVALFGTLIER
ncbi:MAG TPA: heme exporter protein CcmB [Polyangiaceae bacterium]